MRIASKCVRVALLALIAFVAQAQERHYRALVIGNGSYPEKPLRWPVANARAVAGRLKELGYQVTALENASGRRFSQALATLRQSIGAGDVVLFYYAGRATRARETSSLVPIDETGPSHELFHDQGVPLPPVLDMLERSRSAANVIVLDVLAEWPVLGLEISKEWLASIARPTRRTVIVSGVDPGIGSVTAKLLHALQAPTQPLADLSAELGGPRADLQGPPIPRAPATASATPEVAAPQQTQPEPAQSAPAPPAPTQPEPAQPTPAPVPASPPSPAADSPIAGAPALIRFPTLDAPTHPAAGVPMSVLVSLTTARRTPAAAVAQVGPGVEKTPEGALQLNLPCQTKCELEVVLTAAGFEIAGSNTATIEMTTDGDSTPARFSLRALQPGQASLEASFWCQGAFLARVVLPVE